MSGFLAYSFAMADTGQQTLTLQQALGLAAEHQNAGRLPEAEGVYQQILQVAPNQPVALYRLGLIAHQVGKNDIALDFIARAVAIKTDFAEAHWELGNLLHKLGELYKAVASHKNAISAKPDFAEAHCDLGISLQKLGLLDEAVDHYRRALAIRPDFDKAQKFLESATPTLGRLNDVIAQCQNAVDVKPDDAEAHVKLGNALKDLARFDDAIAHYRRAIDIKPNFADAHCNLSIALMKQVQNLPRVSAPVARLSFFVSYLENLGALNSTPENLINNKGDCIPLLTNSFLHWFETGKWADLKLLELGSGNSTFYFSKFFKSVTSYENNKKWFEAFQAKVPENVNYIYANQIRSELKNEDLEKYDVILVDAAENRAKIARVISDSGYSGLIFFDNSECYRRGIDIFSQAGFFEIPFFGIKPVYDRMSCTSVMIKSERLATWFTSDWNRLPGMMLSQDHNAWDDENSNQ